MYIQIDRQVGRQIDRQTDRQIDRYRYKYRYINTVEDFVKTSKYLQEKMCF